MKKIVFFGVLVYALISCQTNKVVNTATNCNNSKDSVYIVKQELEHSEVYTLYHCDRKIYEITTEDGSSIDYQYHYNDKTVDYNCYSVYNNSGDCSKYVFFNRKNRVFYTTKTCFSGFYPEKSNIDFENLKLVLYNNNDNLGYENIILEDSILFVPYSSTTKNITAKIILLLK
ncbi:MAG: hypothetical protein LBD45_00945 [Bacteroidales bacterium]|jgi:hypothetical protein|nr:hypothetical protein [Bacteroidales bacterium]